MLGARTTGEANHVTNLKLTDDEVLCLDGKCRPEIQTEVENARARLACVAKHATLPPALAGFIADVVAEARKSGRLVCRNASLRHCKLCNKAAGYAVRKRSSYKGAKGSPDWSRPLVLHGVELADDFVRVTDHIRLGGCLTCMDAVKPALVEALADVQCELPERLTGKPPAWKKHSLKKCRRCGWEGHEGQLGLMPGLLGGPQIRGVCPGCGVKEELFNRTFDTPSGHVVVRV